MTATQRQRINAAETIARNLVAYHAAAGRECLLPAAHLADALVFADLQAQQYTSARRALRAMSIAPNKAQSTSPDGVRSEAAALLSQLSKVEADEGQRYRLHAIARDLCVLWRDGSLPFDIAADVTARLA